MSKSNVIVGGALVALGMGIVSLAVSVQIDARWSQSFKYSYPPFAAASATPAQASLGAESGSLLASQAGADSKSLRADGSGS